VNHDADERLRVYRAALHESGIEPRPERELPGDLTEPLVSRRSSVCSRCVTEQRTSSRRTMRWRSAH
jgi:hypothetical protein